MTRIALAALALACACFPALAETQAPPAALPWGDGVAAFARFVYDLMLRIILPILAGAIYAAISKVAPWAALVLSQQRIEAMAQAAADYGLNAVTGAAKGKTLTIGQAREVIEVGTQYVARAAPSKVVEKAGGVEGIAQRVFRKLDLDEAANVLNTLIPAVDALDRNTPAALAKGRAK